MFKTNGSEPRRIIISHKSNLPGSRLQNAKCWNLKQTPSGVYGTCDILHGCASVRACLIGVSFTCQFVQPGICGVIFSCMCGQRGTTTVSVFADTLSAEQTHEDCVTRECVSLAAFILGSSEAALHNWSRAQHQISRKQHHLAPCWKHPEKFKYSEISCPPKVISLFVGTSTSWWISPGWANPH